MARSLTFVPADVALLALAVACSTGLGHVVRAAPAAVPLDLRDIDAVPLDVPDEWMWSEWLGGWMGG